MPLVTKELYNLEVIKRNQPDKYHIPTESARQVSYSDGISQTSIIFRRNQPDKYHIPGTKKLIYLVTYQIDTSNVVILV